MTAPRTDLAASRVARHVRAAVAALLVAVAVLAACLGVVAHWSDSVLLDTDAFAAAMEPVIEDDSVRDEATDRIAGALIELFDIRELARSVLPGAEQLVTDEMVAEFETLVRETVGSAVATDTFTELWLAEMRSWHRSLASAIRSAEPGAPLETSAMRITLGPYIDLLAEQVEDPLVQTLIVDFVPSTFREMRVEVFDAQPVAERLERLADLHAVRSYFPWVAAVAFLLAFVAAPVTGYALLGGGAALVIGSQATLRLVQVEAARIDGLMLSAFSASPASATEFSSALLGELEAWMGNLTWAGALMGAVCVASLLTRSARRRSAG